MVVYSQPDPSYTRRDARQPVKQIDSATRHRPIATTVSERVFYFPSYEIILDELRDYRFYADDMLHPSPLAIRYLWERFSETFFSAETKQVIMAVQDIRRDLAHKPFHPESEAYQRF